MIIQQEVAEMIVKSFATLSKNIAIQAHGYLASHSKPIGYCKYPILQPKIECSDPETQKSIDEIPYNKFNIPRYELRDFPKDRVLYSAIFDGYGNDTIDILENSEFQALVKTIVENDELKRCFFEDEKNCEYTIKSIVRDIVIKYLYNINATDDVPNNIEELIFDITLLKLWRYLGNSLEIDICIPISLLTFESDTIPLSDTIEIVRIPEEVQKARKQACQYEMNNEGYVAACATHMLVLHGYQLDNKEYISINYTTRNYHIYPLDEIDNIFSIIRIVTGFSCGYAQVLSVPLDWFDTIFEDLKPMYGAKTPFVNSKELEKHWMQLDINTVSKSQITSIQTLYGNLNAIKNKDQNSNFMFALKRLNRCMLRNEQDDMAIDATIGLEALLSGGAKTEITYTLSNRIGVVFSKNNDTDYKISECRDIMKKIYAYRSTVVHGGKIKEKNKYIDINGEKREIEKIAVDFLRQTLFFVLNNPQYLDAQKFDSFIDEAIANNE